jgi:CRISPR/Cas system CMR-associated protein Cmr5 small subunit
VYLNKACIEEPSWQVLRFTVNRQPCLLWGTNRCEQEKNGRAYLREAIQALTVHEKDFLESESATTLESIRETNNQDCSWYKQYLHALQILGIKDWLKPVETTGQTTSQ